MRARIPLRSISDAELDGEINAETNEEHSEGYRDQVQRSYQPQPDSGCENQPDNQIHNDGQDDTCLLQREPQYETDKKQRHRALQDRAVRDGAKSLLPQPPPSAHPPLHSFFL